jgi:hypothetical protein
VAATPAPYSLSAFDRFAMRRSCIAALEAMAKLHVLISVNQPSHARPLEVVGTPISLPEMI